MTDDDVIIAEDQPIEVVLASPSLDPRRHAMRDDLAAHYLEGRISPRRFSEGESAQIVRGAVPLRRAADVALGLETEALFGETLTVYEETEGWAWVQLARDDYVGYIPADAISRNIIAPTHRVQALGTFLYPAPDFKTPPIMHLAMNSVLTVVNGDDQFVEIEQGGFIISRHVAPLDRTARDYAEIAERFIATPYLWGGRTRIGIDCSGLVQTAFQAAGLAAPRDSDMQLAELGDQIEVSPDFEGLERGDLVFWKGHVGIMADSVMLVHANAHHMMVAFEPVQEAAIRIAKTGGPITAVKRLGIVALG